MSPSGQPPVQRDSATDAPRDFDEAVRRADYAAVFGSAATFVGVRSVDRHDPAAYQDVDVVILGAPFDGGTSYRPGARFAPQAIRRADYLPAVPYRPHLDLGLDPFGELDVVDAGDVPTPSGEMDRAFALLEDAVADVVAAGAVPVVLGGDHSVALPDMRGVARHRGDRSFAVIHFDAHADIGDVSDFGSRYGHGTVMRRLIEGGTVRGNQFFQVGLRGYWPGPRTLEWAASRGIRSFTTSDLETRGIHKCLAEVFERASASSGVYLSVDIDVVDPGMAPGTGTPEVGGLTSRQLLDAVRACAASVDLVGFELVEVSPPYDGPGEITTFLANRVVLEVLSGLACRRRGRGTPRAGAAMGEGRDG